MFGIKCMPVAQSISPDQSVTLPINFRALLIGQINARFLIRYEVEDLPEDCPPACKYRLARLVVFLNSQLAFKIVPYVNLSAKQVDKYVVNFQTWQKLSSSWYDRPKFNSIEIVRGQQRWQISKKDEGGNFVTIEQHASDSET